MLKRTGATGAIAQQEMQTYPNLPSKISQGSLGTISKIPSQHQIPTAKQIATFR